MVTRTKEEPGEQYKCTNDGENNFCVVSQSYLERLWIANYNNNSMDSDTQSAPFPPLTSNRRWSKFTLVETTRLGSLVPRHGYSEMAALRLSMDLFYQ